MSPKLLLVKSITLLYRESQLPDHFENSADVVRQIVTDIKLAEVNIGIDHDRDILAALKGTAIELCDAPLGTVHEEQEMLQRIRVNCAEDIDLYEAFKSGIEGELPPETLKRNCLNVKRSLANHYREAKIAEIMHKANNTIKFKRATIKDMKRFVSEICAELEPYQVDVESKDPAVVSQVNMSDLSGVTSIFGEIKEQLAGGTVLRTGWQGINRMLDGGFRRGEQWVIGALQHNYKTGFSLTLFKQIALYNKPILKDPEKKPLLLRISFEDSLLLNFQFLYASLKENETGEPVVTDGISAEEMARYVSESLQVNGYYTEFMYVDPSQWTYKDITNKILELEAQGYEIHLCMLDYLLKIPTTGCDQGPMGHDIRNLYERVRNFMSARNICVITPHQLSTDAKIKIRDGQLDFVRSLVGGGYYSGSKQIDQVVDGEIFIHIEKVNNEAYLTVQRGKHRKIKQTPIEHLYAVLPFVKNGGIMDDLGKADTTRKKAGGGPIGSGEEIPFWLADEAPA